MPWLRRAGVETALGVVLGVHSLLVTFAMLRPSEGGHVRVAM